MPDTRTAMLERIFEAAKEWRSTRLVVRVMRLNPKRTTPQALQEAGIVEGQALDALAQVVDEAAGLEDTFEI